MTQTATVSNAKAWSKPELVRLGKLADVAGPQSGVTQGAGNKS